MSTPKKLSFAEIVPGQDLSVRITEDNLIFAVDLSMAVTGKNRDDAAKSLRNLPEEIFLPAKFTYRSFPGKGNANTKLVSFQDAIELVMVLPGKVAKETRVKFAEIIRRYMAGDQSLIAEIRTNGQSNAPISQLARASLNEQAVEEREIPTEEELQERKRRLDREDMEMRSMDADIQHKKLSNVRLFADTMKMLNPYWADDARLRIQTEDWLKNVAFNTPLLTNGPQTQGDSAPETRSISVSQVAMEMGKRLSHGQLIQVGSAVARKYREKYGAEPPKHNQWVDGAERKVNSYTERDRELVVEALREALIL